MICVGESFKTRHLELIWLVEQAYGHSWVEWWFFIWVIIMSHTFNQLKHVSIGYKVLIGNIRWVVLATKIFFFCCKSVFRHLAFSVYQKGHLRSIKVKFDSVKVISRWIQDRALGPKAVRSNEWPIFELGHPPIRIFSFKIGVQFRPWPGL